MTVGEQLRQAREALGLSLEQAAKATHVRVHYLEALENDQRNALPSVVQGRGFLRLYAGFLNLSTTDILNAWDGKPQPAEPPPVNPPSEPAEDLAADSLEQVEVENEPAAASSSPHAVGNAGETSESQQIFEEIGRMLRAQRTALGLSLAEVERYTRLRQHYLQSIEDGRMEGLPSPVQGRGMFSNYARFLNMDEDAIMLRFAQGLQARRIERLPKAEPPGIFQNKKRPARPAPGWRRFLTPDLLFGIAAAAIILFYVLWSTARIGELNVSNEPEATLPAISDILLTDQVLSPSPSVEPTSEFGTATTPEDIPTATQTPAEPGLPVRETELATLEPTPTLQAMNNDPLQVYIVARERAWLRVTTDGAEAFLGRVVPGNAYAFSGTRQVEILTGNAAALQVFFNQADLGVLGLTGQVVGMVFSPEGAMTPTPAASPTPQPRPETATPLPSPSATASPTVTPFVPAP